MTETMSRIKAKGAEVKGEIKSAAGHTKGDIMDKGHKETTGSAERAANVVAKKGGMAPRKMEEHADSKAAGARGQAKSEMKQQHKEETKSSKKESHRAGR